MHPTLRWTPSCVDRGAMRSAWIGKMACWPRRATARISNPNHASIFGPRFLPRTRGVISAVSGADVILDCGGVEDEDGRKARFSNSKRLPVAAPKPPSPPAWKNHIIGITSRSLQAARLADEWPDKREVLYIVDVPGSASPGSVVLK